MKLVNMIVKAGIGAAAAIVTVTALPIAGPIGAITATGAAISSTVGAGAGIIDEIMEDDE